jgi:hypothetical protein
VASPFICGEPPFWYMMLFSVDVCDSSDVVGTVSEFENVKTI